MKMALDNKRTLKSMTLKSDLYSIDVQCTCTIVHVKEMALNRHINYMIVIYRPIGKVSNVPRWGIVSNFQQMITMHYN